jgi:transcriptional regulator with XRE-family HTH domain
MGGRSPEHVAFGAAVRALRGRSQLTQEALAHKCDMDRTYLSGIERGVRNPSLTNILRIAASLGVTPVELFVDAQRQLAKAGDVGEGEPVGASPTQAPLRGKHSNKT